MALVIATQETVYELVDHTRIQKSQDAREITVYTLAELKDIDAKAYAQAIDKTIDYCWAIWEPSLFTEDIMYRVGDGYPPFDLDEKTLEWDMGNGTMRGKGTVRVRDYMTQYRLRNKYRALWYAIDHYDLNPDVEVSFGFYYEKGHCDISELQSEIDYCDEIYTDKPRYARICHQINLLEADIRSWMKDIYSELRRLMMAENDYHYSKEFAREEAEALELTFTAEGAIYAN